MLFGYLHIQKAFLQQAVPEVLLHIILTMNKKQRFYFPRILAGKELAQIFIITVYAHTADGSNFGIHLMINPKNSYFFCTGYQSATQRVGFAISGKQNRIAAVLNSIADMMFYPAAFGHAAGRNNNAGSVAKVKQLGFVDRLNELQPFKSKRVLV